MAEELDAYEQIGPGDPDPLGLDKKLRQLQSTKGTSPDPLGLEAKLRATQQPKQEQPAFQLSEPTLRSIPKESVVTPSAPNEKINIPRSEVQYIPDEKTYKIQQQRGKAKVAHEKVNAALVSNDVQYEKKLRESRRDNFTVQDLRNEYKQKGLILAPQDEQRALQKEKDRLYNLPVTNEELTDFKTGTILTPKLSRKFIKDLNDKDISESAYQVDKFNELANDPDPNAHNRIEKINEVAKGIKKGTYVYDPETKTVVQPMGTISSIMEGVKNKFKADNEHDFYKNTTNDAAIIGQLEDERNNPELDEPIKVPRGKVNEALKSVAEMPVLPMVAGVAGTVGGTFIGNPELGTVAATTLGAYENRKAQYTSTFKQVYNELRNQNKTPFEALSEARKQAENAQEIGTITGAAQGYLGAKIGEIPVKGTTFSLGYQKAVGDFLKKNGSDLGKIVLDATAQGGIGVAGEIAKNKLAQAAGIKRDWDENTESTFWGNALMTAGIGAAIKLGRGMSKVNYKTILSGLTKNVPNETIEAAVQEKVTSSQITQEAANQALNEINEYRAKDLQIPANVTEEARFKIQDNIDKINELQSKKDATHESLQGPIKEQIQKLIDDNLALAKETVKEEKPVSGLEKSKEKEAIEFAHELVDEGILPDQYHDEIKKDPINFWKTIAQQAQNRDENWKPLSNPLDEQAVRDNYGDTVVDYAKELFPAPEIHEVPKSVSVIQPGEIKHPETITIAPKEEIRPASENIMPNKDFQTMGMGKDEGQPETKEAREQMKERMVQGDVPIDGEGGKGETGRGFAGRVLSAWENLKKSGDNNTSLITHSSVLKAIKTWENSKTWEGIEKPADPTKMNSEQWKRFADEYNKERTENGDLETFKGDKGDIHVIRHGQTEDNKMNKFRSGNTNLTEEGIQQAHEVGQKLQEKTGGNVPQIITSDLPRAVHTSNIIHENLKPTEHGTIPIGSSAEIHVGETPGDSQPVGEGVSKSGETTGTQEGQSKEEGNAPGKEKVMASGGGGNLVGISHDALNDLAQRLGLPQIERGQVRTPEQYAQMGRELLRQGVDPNTVLNSHLEPHEKASVARAYLEEMVKNADAIADKNSAQYRAALQGIADFNANVVKKLGTEWAELGRALQGRRDLDTDSFTAVSLKITDDTGKPLTSDQAQKIKELTEKNQELQSKLDDLDAKLIKDTDADLGKETKATSTKEPKAKKTHDQYVKERKDAFDAARNALKKLRRGGSGLGVSIVPGGRHLSAVAPHIGKIVKSFIAEGVNKLGDIVDAIHDELSKDIIGLRRRDVIDLIAGKYDAKDVVKTNESSEIRKQSRLVAKLEDLQNGLPEDFDKNKTEQSPEVKKLLEQIKKVKKDLADMGYMASKKDEPLSPEEKNIRRLEKELEDLKQGIAKQKSPSRELTDKEIELKEQIKDEREKLGLISSKEKKPLTEQEIQEQHENDVKSIQEQFINKKGDKFTPDEAKSIWGYMKENYLDKGVKFRDAIELVSDDTGLSFEQISNAIVTPKTKRISEARWKQQYDLQKNRLATKRYVDAQNENPFIKAYKKITAARRSESIFGHAGVFIGTHAGMTLFDLPRSKFTIKAFLNAYKFGYGKIANYEKSMEGLKKRKYYEIAQRANLKNNPDIIDNDAEITKPFLSKYLGKFMESGKRGYNAIKILRQDLFDAHYDALSDAEKADPGSAVRIAELVNNATGATNLDLMVRNKQGNVVFDPNEVAFAPGMETARWGKLIRNPAKATSVALQALFKPSSVSVKDKVFAKVWAKRAGTQLATYAGLLTANAGIQALTTDDKEKQVNLLDPTNSDWLKFKFGNTTIDVTSGMLSTLHFIEQMAYQTAFDDSKKYHTTEEKSIGRTALRYGVGKLAPFYGDVAEGILRHDYNGNTMPWSDAKPLHNYNHKLTWEEYAESKLPLPVAEGFKVFYESAHANGMSKNQINQVLNGLQYGSISGLTGFKAHETKNKEGGDGGGAGATSSYSAQKTTKTKHTITHKIHR